MLNQAEDHAPMHRGSGTANGDEIEEMAMGDKELDHAGREHSRKRALCVCIDDFGMHGGIDRAALQLVEMGRVQALGCLVGGAAWHEDHATLRGLNPGQVDLGLHLDFTEFPLRLPSPRKLGTLIAESYLRRLDANEVGAEIRAQLDAFEHALGRPPAFIDGHQHVHQLPVIRDQLLQELRERYRGTGLWVRSTRTPASWLADVKPKIIEMLGSHRMLAMAQSQGLRHNHRLLGAYNFQGGPERYTQLLQKWLHSAKHADLLMTHPSLPVQVGDPLMDARSAEFQVLSGKPFATMLDAEGIQLLPMSTILAAVNSANKIKNA